MIIIDATNLILGRLATFAAKQALLGEEVVVVNYEKAIVSGDRKMVIDAYLRKIHRGIPLGGPYYPKQPDRIVRRTIRGMLPRKKAPGEEAFKRVMCYIGVPEKHAGAATVTIDGAHVSKLPNLKYVQLDDIAKNMGARA